MATCNNSMNKFYKQLTTFKLRPASWVLFFVLIGFSLRVQALSYQPLWGDEGWSFYLAGQTLPQLIVLTAIDIHPPLYYILLKSWFAVVGLGPETARFFSVIVGTSLIPAVGVTGQRLFNRSVGMVAAALTAVMPLAVYYSQEVRMYGLVTLLGVLSVYCLVRVLSEEWPLLQYQRKSDKHEHVILNEVRAKNLHDKPLKQGKAIPHGNSSYHDTDLGRRMTSGNSLPWLAGYIITATAALYTMYYAAFLLLFQGLYVLFIYMRQPRQLLRRLPPFVIIGLLYLPWPIYIAKRLLTYIDNKKEVEAYLPLNLWQFFSRYFSAFSAGHINEIVPTYSWVAWLGIILIIIGLVVAKSKWRLLLILYMSVPMLVVFIINLLYPFTPPYFERTLLLVAPAIWLFMAVALVWLWQQQRVLASIAAGGLGLTIVISLTVFYSIPRYPDEDYRPLLKEVAARATAEDTLLGSYQWQLGLYQAYLPLPRPRLFAVPGWGQGWAADAGNAPQLAADLTDIFAQSPRLWFPAYQASGHIWEDEAEAAIAQLGHPALLTWYSPQTKLTLAAAAQTPQQTVPSTKFENLLLLQSAQVGGQEYQAGRDIIPITLQWQKQGNLIDEYRVNLRLIDAAGRTWATRDSHPQAGQTHFADLNSGDTLTDKHGLLTPAGAPPGSYRLMLSTRQVDTNHPLDVVDEVGQPLGAELYLADITLTTPDPLLGVDALPVQVELNDEADFAQQLQLVGYSLGQGPFKSGETMPLILFWQALADKLGPLQVQVELKDATGQTVITYQQAPIWPTTEWSHKIFLRDPHDVLLPPTLPPGQYQLSVSVVAPKQGRLPVAGEDSVRLTTVTTIDRPHNFEPPTPQSTLNFNFNNQALLMGLDLPQPQVVSGEIVDLTLYWQVLSPLARNWTVFVHLLDNQGQIVSQQDQIPGRGQFPTTGWLPQEYLVDLYALPIPADTPTGHYILKIGLYDAHDFSLLPLVEGNDIIGDHVTLESWPISVE